MPTYQYICDVDDGGCGNLQEVNCLMSEHEESKPKSCPKCRKRKPIRQVFDLGTVHIPKTLGSFADKRTGKMSEDERHHIHEQNTEYRKKDKDPAWVQTEHGLVHKSKLK